MKKILLLIVLSLVLPVTAKAQENTTRNKAVICETFGKYCKQALRVSWCESRWHTWAQNGQYLGLFQMGSSERRLYGHHPNNPRLQAKAAYKYFKESGYDWSPWSCKP